MKRREDEADAPEVEEQNEELERQRQDKKPRADCPYLDTINRAMLDFDFEKLCSISLSNLNVYACLRCGNTFRAEARPLTPTFTALNADHHVFINLRTHQVYALPEGYEVIHASLDDIKYVLSPVYDTRGYRKTPQ